MKEAAARLKHGDDVMTLKTDWAKDLFKKVSKENGASSSQIEEVINKQELEIHNPDGMFEILEKIRMIKRNI